MDYYQGNLKQFAEELLAKGKGNGQMLIVAQLDDKVIKDMCNKGVALQSVSIVVTQQTIFKYAHHPKAKKGAVIPVEQYDLIEKALITLYTFMRIRLKRNLFMSSRIHLNISD